MANKINLDALENLGKLGNDVVKQLNQIQEAAKATAKGVEDSASSSLNSALSTAQTLANKLSGANAATVKSLTQQKAFTKDLAKAEVQRVKLLRQSAYYGDLASSSTGKQAKNLRKLQGDLLAAADYMEDLADSAKEVEGSFEELNKDTRFFDNLSDIVQEIPVLRKLAPEFKKAADAAREAGGGTKGWAKGISELSKVGLKSAGIFAAGKAFEGLLIGNQRVTDLSRSFNISREAAQSLNNEVVTLAKGTTFTIDGLLAYQSSLSNSLGATVDFSAENAKTFATMTEKLGLSVEEATKLQIISSGTGKTVQEQTNSIVGQTMALADSNKLGIRYQDIMKDIAAASEATVMTNNKFPGGIARAAFEARKLGLSLMQMDQTASSLLNFESSIEAELAAELLTGKELNLERARMAALTGDNATLAAELAKNFGTAEEFSRQNVLAQEAQAKAMGMTRQELAGALSRQQALKDLSTEFNGIRLDGLTLDEQVAKIQEEAKKLGKGELSRADALSKLGEKELARQEKNQSTQEAMAQAMEDMKNATSSLAKGLEPITAVFQGISNNAGAILGIMTALGLLSFGNIFKLGSVVKNLGKGGGKGGSNFAAAAAKGLSDKQILSGFGGKAAMQEAKVGEKVAGKGLGKMAGKFAGKGLLKRIPILGSVLGIGFAIDRLIKGDVAGAGLETLSAGAGLLDLVAPGAGTVTSLGIDAGIAARDLNQEPKMATGGIVTSPTRALIGEAGPEAVIPLNQLYAKLDELISVVKSGGHVYMDGNKVGHTLALSTYKSN